MCGGARVRWLHFASVRRTMRTCRHYHFEAVLFFCCCIVIKLNALDRSTTTFHDMAIIYRLRCEFCSINVRAWSLHKLYLKLIWILSGSFNWKVSAHICVRVEWPPAAPTLISWIKYFIYIINTQSYNCLIKWLIYNYC